MPPKATRQTLAEPPNVDRDAERLEDRLQLECAARAEAERRLDAKSKELNQVRRELAGQVRAVSALLDGAPFSILTIEPDLTIGPRYSPAAPALLGLEPAALAGAPAIDTLTSAFRLAKDEGALFAEAMECVIGHYRLNWELNAEHFPREAHRAGPKNDRILELLWTPMIDAADEIVTSALVTVRDVTVEREAAVKLAARDKACNRLVGAVEQLVRAPRAHLPSFFDEADRQVTVIEHALADDALDADAENRVLAAVHSLKGGARMLGFAPFADQLHQMEDYLAEPAPMSRRRAVWGATAETYEGLREAFRDLFQFEAPQERLLAAIAAPPLAAARTALAEAGIAARVRVHDALGALPHALAEAMSEALRHLIANMVDHSILPAADRGAISRADILLTGRQGRRRLTVTLSDNGAGFDRAAIADRAARLGVVQDAADPLSVVFEPRFSTARIVTDRSGRGVGMSAALAAVVGAGGAIALGERRGGGSKLKLIFPRAG